MRNSVSLWLFCVVSFCLLVVSIVQFGVINTQRKDIFALKIQQKQVQYQTSMTIESLQNDVFKLTENVSVLDPILSGDLYFLCSQFMSDKELKIIRDNQDKIEKYISYQSLDELANNNSISKISNSLKSHFNQYSEIAKRINQEAKFWSEKLNKKNDTTKTNKQN